jgi:multidrug resistance efflux pump
MNEIYRQLGKDGMPNHLQATDSIYLEGKRSRVRYWLLGTVVLAIIVLFLPWTQNIRTRGKVTTLRQEHRPQQMNSIIAGRIIKWYVKEGDFVRRGDTIAQLAEVKDSYLDPKLLERTRDQVIAKQSGVAYYSTKISAIDAQIAAMEQTLALKTRQLKLKVVADSMEAAAAANDHRIAEEQLRRQRIMKDSGLASTLQLEQRIQAVQNTLAKKISAETKFLNTRTDLMQVQQEFFEKLAKARGEKASAGSEIASTQAEIAKLDNQYANYAIRNGMYYLLAPQDGQVTQAAKSGINEIVKEGEKIAEIIPTQVEHAVEMFVRPFDLPLLSKGQTVRFLFDGYPAIVFSGWPKASYGTFSGKIVAIESSTSDNGMFRILVSPDTTVKPWPITLKMGAGAYGIALLNTVPVWYELWRNVNGFPPDFYVGKKDKDDSKKAK